MLSNPTPKISWYWCRRFRAAISNTALFGLRNRFISTTPPRRTTLRPLAFRRDHFPAPIKIRNQVDRMLGGSFTVLNLEINLGWPPRWGLIKDSAVPPVWRSGFHSHEFLKELLWDSNQTGRAQHTLWQFVQLWMSQHQEPSAQNASLSWYPATTARRLLTWFELIYMLPLPDGMLKDLLLCSVRQTRWLSKCARFKGHDSERVIEAIALTTAGVFFEGPWANHIRHKGLELLDHAFYNLANSAGDLHSRSPGENLELSRRFASLAFWLNAVDRPSALRIQQWSKSLADTAGLLRHNDGQLPLFNDTCLDGDVPAIPSKGLSTWVNDWYVHRSHQIVLIFDAGSLGNLPYNKVGHAAPLNFEMSWGPKRIFVDSGLCAPSGERHQVHREEAAHNILCPPNRTAVRFGKNGLVNDGATTLRRSVKTPFGIWITASHNYYRRSGIPKVTRVWFIPHNGSCVFSVHLSSARNGVRELLHLAPTITPQALAPHVLGLVAQEPLIFQTNPDTSIRILNVQTSPNTFIQIPNTAIELKPSSGTQGLVYWSVRAGKTPSTSEVKLVNGTLVITDETFGIAGPQTLQLA